MTRFYSCTFRPFRRAGQVSQRTVRTRDRIQELQRVALQRHRFVSTEGRVGQEPRLPGARGGRDHAHVQRRRYQRPVRKPVDQVREPNRMQGQDANDKNQKQQNQPVGRGANGRENADSSTSSTKTNK